MGGGEKEGMQVPPIAPSLVRVSLPRQRSPPLASPCSPIHARQPLQSLSRSQALCPGLSPRRCDLGSDPGPYVSPTELKAITSVKGKGISSGKFSGRVSRTTRPALGPCATGGGSDPIKESPPREGGSYRTRRKVRVIPDSGCLGPAVQLGGKHRLRLSYTPQTPSMVRKHPKENLK